jgi:hypothetical protein
MVRNAVATKKHYIYNTTKNIKKKQQKPIFCRFAASKLFLTAKYVENYTENTKKKYKLN